MVPSTAHNISRRETRRVSSDPAAASTNGIRAINQMPQARLLSPAQMDHPLRLGGSIDGFDDKFPVIFPEV